MSGAGNATTMTPNPVGSVPAAAVGAASLAAALVKGQETIRQAPGRLYEPCVRKPFAYAVTAHTTQPALHYIDSTIPLHPKSEISIL